MARRKKKDVKPTVAPQEQGTIAPWQLWAAAFSGAILLAAAMPRIDLQPVAWIAPLPWLWLISRKELPGKRPYLVLWLAGLALWAWVLFGISRAHPALIAGWLVLSAYVAVYTPLFVGMTRQMVYVWRVPLVIAAPVVWAGLELIRGHFATGFPVGLLSHTQTDFPILLQIADLGGGYALSFVMMAVAAGALDGHYRWWEDRQRAAAVKRVFFAAALLMGTVVYGFNMLKPTPFGHNDLPLRVCLVQGALDTEFEMSPKRVKEVMDHYHELTDQAIREYPQMDLIVWPESSCPAFPYLVAAPHYKPPVESKLTPEEFQEGIEESNRRFTTFLADVCKAANAPLLLSTTTLEYDQPGLPHVYNTALWTDREGKIAGTYHKMHPVMFGEYIPFFAWFPFLYQLTPMPGGLTPGKQAEVVQLFREAEFTFESAPGETTHQRHTSNYRLAPSICFESTLPHLIRGQVAQLRVRGQEPDFLVNVTNDGWFWGSGILDLHFRCAIFRAVELRKPVLIAANTGISAHIDGNGIVRQSAPRRQAKVLLAEVGRDGRTSVYSKIGDIPAWLCAAVAVAALAHAFWQWRQARTKPATT